MILELGSPSSFALSTRYEDNLVKFWAGQMSEEAARKAIPSAAFSQFRKVREGHHVQLLFFSAMRAAQDGKIDKAIKKLEAALKIAPKGTSYYLLSKHELKHLRHAAKIR
jgi:ATP-dependent protease HslVU (ClpYQ) peptidase subunit